MQQNLTTAKFLATLDHYLIAGKKMPRVKFKAKQGEFQFCEECSTSSGKWHTPGCKLEKSGCKNHQFIVDCNCACQTAGEPV